MNRIDAKRPLQCAACNLKEHSLHQEKPPFLMRDKLEYLDAISDDTFRNTVGISWIVIIAINYIKNVVSLENGGQSQEETDVLGGVRVGQTLRVHPSRP